ncbi:hypothetical protein HanPI659440_Chr05g0188411 [Helianthus annuus]|nr:hypothetical protein HanPI659440_Chr05g0188411 [Helianthus annuus]
MHPIGMVRVPHFEFVCRSMHIEPTVNRFRVFHQMHCSQGFYSFVQRASAKKILLQPPKFFHDWKPKFFYIKAGVILMEMSSRGKEDVLPKALVGSGMSLCWRMNREDKPVYMKDGKGKIWGFLTLFFEFAPFLLFSVVSLYVVAFEREGGKMTIVSKRADEELWYLQIVKNFVLPRDEDLVAQPLTGAVMKKPKAEPRDAADIPASNADDPIDLESSPKFLLRTKAGKRKQAEVDAEAQPAKKVQKRKITRRGNLDAFIAKPPPKKPTSPVHAEPASAVNEDLPPSPSRAPISEQLESTQAVGKDEAEKTTGAGNPEFEKPVEFVVETGKVVVSETAEVESARIKSPEVMARDAEKGKFVPEDPVITIPVSAPTPAPVNVEKNPTGDQGASSYDEENDPLRPDETLGDHYYRTYTERKASEIHTLVWNLKKGDTFSNWRVCHDCCKVPFVLQRLSFKKIVLKNKLTMLTLRKLLGIRLLRNV